MPNFIPKLLIYFSDNQQNKKRNFSNIALSFCLIVTALSNIAVAQSQSISTSVRVIVNSNLDGAVQPNNVLTLREAIQIVNGALPLEKLSSAEKAQVTPSATPRIDFNLPDQQTTIALQDILPPLTAPGLIIDGASQPGYNTNKSATAEISIPVPIISIKPDSTRNILRGFTVLAKTTIRGLSIYGFTSQHERTASTPPADIFISDKVPEANIHASYAAIPSSHFFKSSFRYRKRCN